MRILLCLALMYCCTAAAVVETYEFESDVLRVRYYKFVDELRCPNCQSQNLAGSDSIVAADLRREVHRLLHDDLSDQQIVDYMVERYGDYILYRPRFKAETIALWLAPALFLFLGILVVLFAVRRHRAGATSESELTATDQKTLRELLQSESAEEISQTSQEKTSND